MKFGIRNTSFVYPNRTGNIWEDTKAHIQRAERDGFVSFWVMDHFYQLPAHGSVEEPFLDAWTVLPALAAVTRRIRLGAMVVDGLPPLGESQAYQLWLIRDGQRTSGAVFSTDENTYGGTCIRAPLSLLEYSSVGITIEPAGGSEQPTGVRVLGGPLFKP